MKIVTDFRKMVNIDGLWTSNCNFTKHSLFGNSSTSLVTIYEYIIVAYFKFM